MPPRRAAAARANGGGNKSETFQGIEDRGLWDVQVDVSLITQHGGTVLKTVSSKADDPTHLVTTSAEYSAPKTAKTKDVIALKEAGKDVKIVSLEWLNKCVAEEKKVDEAEFEVKQEGEEDEMQVDAEEKPKSKQAANGKGKGKKRARSPSPVEDEEEEEEEEEEEKPAKPEPKMVTRVTKNNVAVDEMFSQKSTFHVHVDPATGVPWDANLNQTNAGKNNNKFYKIQVLKSDTGNKFTCFTRWGRVGENGQNKDLGGGTEQGAIAEFQKKFKDKAKIPWEQRSSSAPKAGAYTFIEMAYDAEEEEAEEERPAKKQDTKERKDTVSTLDKRVQELTKNQVMKELNYDANKLPLGKLSKNTISKGYEVLRRIADILATEIDDREEGWASEVSTLTDNYYTYIPHAFGRNIGPRINHSKILKDEMDLLDNLSEMKIAEKLMKEVEPVDEHPLDSQFKTLNLE
ncbi:hypothetical protein BT69DRAFT_1296530 [Atractiella rhizophila]|nr:hypothetical protein BT69DRAFT_1296530 [Atractiella rhizophila]